MNLMKTLDKKDIKISLKKKKFLFGSSALDTKTFKLNDLATKCNMEKSFSMGKDGQFTLHFSIHTPIKGKDFEEIPVKKLVIDNYPEPLRSGK